jgi:hypothetical protein
MAVDIKYAKNLISTVDMEMVNYFWYCTVVTVVFVHHGHDVGMLGKTVPGQFPFSYRFERPRAD